MFEIEEFWIVNFTKAPVFWFSQNKTLNPDAEHEFITQICQHIEELENGAEVMHTEHMGVLEIGGFFYYYVGSPGINCIFIAKSLKEFHPISIYFDLCSIERYFTPTFMKELKILENDESKAETFLKDFKDKFENSFFKEYFQKNLC